jgi:nitrogen fixation protein FixH
MTPYSARRAKPRSGRWIPWAFVAGFALVIAVNAALIWFAVGSFSGLAEAHPYQAGLAHNRTLEAARAQDALGWQADLAVAPAGKSGEVHVSLALRDRNGAPVLPESVTAEFVRPAAKGHDRSVSLSVGPNDRYETTVPLGLPGQWEVRILARHAGGSWQTAQRVMVP